VRQGAIAWRSEDELALLLFMAGPQLGHQPFFGDFVCLECVCRLSLGMCAIENLNVVCLARCNNMAHARRKDEMSSFV
jgi:hypothetical protein